MISVGIKGKVRKVGKDYVSIYVYAKDGGFDLQKFVGSEVIGLVSVKNGELNSALWIRGKVYKVGDNYVSIYVYRTDGGDSLRKFIGSSVIGVLQVKGR